MPSRAGPGVGFIGDCLLRKQPEERSGERLATMPLVAVTCADGHAPAARGAAAAEHGCARLGLHTRAETVLLQAALAVGLKCALRHEMRSSICRINLCFGSTFKYIAAAVSGPAGGSGSVCDIAFPPRLEPGSIFA